MTRMRWSALALSLVVLAGAAAIGLMSQHPTAGARSGGFPGYSGNPATNNGRDCSQCHLGGDEPTVVIDGPDRLAPGETGSFSLTITGGQGVGGGLDVSVTGGSLAVPEGSVDVRLASDEIVHSATKPTDLNGEIVFEYLFTAPGQPGAVTMYGAGNSVNGNGQTSGDMPSTTVLELTIAEGGATPTATIEPTTTMTPTEVPPPTPTVPAGTPTPTPTAIPLPGETIIEDLNAALGLWWGAGLGLMVGEGGTGTAAPGSFGPGNQDGAVRGFDPSDPEQSITVAEGFANAIDPGGGIVGANHAIGYAPGGVPAVLAAQAGGPGHLEDARKAKIIRIGIDGQQEIFADPWAFEEENNPDGLPPTEDEVTSGIDSNPWRIVEQGDRMYVVDAGANDILTMDPADGTLGLWAVFPQLDPEGAQQPIPVGLAFDPSDGRVAYATLLGRFPPPDGSPGSGQIRRLVDLNEDGDVLDEGENELWADGLFLPMDLAFSPANGELYVTELGFGRISIVDLDQGSDPNQRLTPRVDGIPALTAMIFDEEGNALVAATGFPPPPPAAPLRAERVIRVSAADLAPDPVETGAIYLPLTLNGE